MNPSKILEAVGYCIAFVSVGAGVLVLTGTFIPETTPSQLRIMFGIVLVLLGCYRASITYVRSAQKKRELIHGDDDE
jgi:cytochrome c biogenesis protein CcdA